MIVWQACKNELLPGVDSWIIQTRRRIVTVYGFTVVARVENVHFSRASTLFRGILRAWLLELLLERVVFARTTANKLFVTSCANSGADALLIGPVISCWSSRNTARRTICLDVLVEAGTVLFVEETVDRVVAALEVWAGDNCLLMGDGGLELNACIDFNCRSETRTNAAFRLTQIVKIGNTFCVFLQLSLANALSLATQWTALSPFFPWHSESKTLVTFFSKLSSKTDNYSTYSLSAQAWQESRIDWHSTWEPSSIWLRTSSVAGSTWCLPWGGPPTSHLNTWTWQPLHE